MFINYLKVAIRNILRNRVFSVINILGLAVSMSICLLVIKMIFGMYSSDRFHLNKNRIYRVITFEKGEGYSGYELATTPEPLAGELEKLSGIEKVVKVRSDFGGDVFWKGKVVPVSGLYSDPVFFDFFSFSLERGDPSTALKEPFSIVITPEWANKMFGDTDPMGQTISMKNLGEFKVTGITNSISHLKTHLKFESIASASTLILLENQGIKSRTIDNWENPYRTYTFFMLEKGAKTSAIEKAFPGIIDTFIPKSDLSFEYMSQKLTDISPGRRLSNQMGHPTEPGMAKTPVSIYLTFLFFTLILGFITGIFPAMYLSRFKPVDVFKDISRIKLFSRTNLRKVLIVVQFTISLFLIFAVIISYKQVNYQKGLDLGYATDDILNVELQEINYGIFKNEILQKPGIESVSATDYLPGTGVVYRKFVKCEKIPDSTLISHLTVDPDFISTMNINLLSGEDFGVISESNPGNYALINEAAVRHLGFITFLTVFISILGLLGMVVFNNENRTNEIGIRKVVGSNNLEILWVISKSFIYMMGLAVLIATPLAWFIGKMLLQNIYNRIALKPGFFIIGIFVMRMKKIHQTMLSLTVSFSHRLTLPNYILPST